MKVQFFDDKLEEFIEKLEKPTISKVLRSIELLGEFAHHLDMPHSKKIGKRLFELRTRGQQEIRVIYTFHEGVIVLLYGFVKKTERIKSQDLRNAKQNLEILDKT